MSHTTDILAALTENTFQRRRLNVTMRMQSTYTMTREWGSRPTQTRMPGAQSCVRPGINVVEPKRQSILEIKAPRAGPYKEFLGSPTDLVSVLNRRLTYVELAKDADGVFHRGGVLAGGRRNEYDLDINI